MPRFSEDGTEHPTESDVPDMEGIYHIGKCPECQSNFPLWANLEAQARHADPAGYELVKARSEARSD